MVPGFRRASALAFAVVAVALVAGACLGPTQFDPSGKAPIGKLEVVVDAGGSIKVSGWALDPETWKSIVVKVGAEGIVHDVVADGDRPDVAARYPRNGRAHGFSHTFGPLSPGLRGICVWVPNTVGGGDDRLLGCENITVSSPDPVGRLETVTSLKPRTITVGGWAFDPNSSGSASVAINVDGKFAKKMVASGTRNDVGTRYGRSAAVGFSTELAATPGKHQVCVGAWNISWGVDRLLGCKTVTVAESTEDRRPIGSLIEVTPLGLGQVRVVGTASDPDGSAGLRVRLDVEGRASLTLPVSGGRFATTLTGVPNGLHAICPVGLDVDGGIGQRGNRAFVCGSVVLGETSVGTAGQAGGAIPVAPPASSPVHDVQRDAGVSVELRDGSVMWFFGDSLDVNQVGDLKYFVNNTAAWAAPGQPTVTRDGASGGRPYLFVAPPAGICAGSTFSKPAMWPESAVAIPQANGTDRVIVFMSKVCLGTEFLDIDPRGMAVVETTYDPANKPIDKRIAGTITQPDLDIGRSSIGAPMSRAAVVGDDGLIYGYHCGQFDPTSSANRDCLAGRVSPAEVNDPSRWRFWNGGDRSLASSWTTDAGAAAAMVTLDVPDAYAPIAAFTVSHDDVHGVYVMVYSPWPGFTDRVEVRVSQSPVGPWTAPVEVRIPGCGETSGGVLYACYAGTAQPKLSSTGLLGLGYYDQLVETGSRGQYMVVTVPFNVVITRP